MRVEEVDEPIRVGAVFGARRIVPKWFVWRRLKRTVKSVHMVWKGREGESPLRYFSVSDGSNLYQLRLDQKTMEWRLEKVSSE